MEQLDLFFFVLTTRTHLLIIGLVLVNSILISSLVVLHLRSCAINALGLADFDITFDFHSIPKFQQQVVGIRKDWFLDANKRENPEGEMHDEICSDT